MIKIIIGTLFFGFMYSIPIIYIEDKMRVKCDLLYNKYINIFHYEYTIEYKLRKNWLYRFILSRQDKRKWKKFRKIIYFDTKL